MRAVDDDLIGKLQAAGLTVHSSVVFVDNTGKRVTYPTPYVVYYSNVGDDRAPRLHGRPTRHSTFFQVTYVGLTAAQAKWAGEKVRLAFFGKRVSVGTARSGLIAIETTQRVRRDDDAIREDGSPLFSGASEGSVSITINEEGALA